MSAQHPESERERWLRYAREDLETARLLHARTDMPPRHVCVFSQQAAEKALKAALIAQRIRVPRTHDLQALSDILAKPLGLEATALIELTDWGAKSRYPEDWTEPTAERAGEALAIAERVVGTVVARFFGEEAVS
jgi:HEPN domain-containing protein